LTRRANQGRSFIIAQFVERQALRTSGRCEPAITVQNVSVGDGGKAIVGNVTQHASVIVSDKNPASAARHAEAAGSRREQDSADAKWEAEA
jgi:hypothetical protein